MERIFILAISAFITLAASAQKGGDKPAQDKAAIKSMCGCQDVTFEYAETFPSDTGYTPKGYHKIVDAVEYITVAAEDPRRIVLQHLLIADSFVIKHWIEDWQYENRQLLAYTQDSIRPSGRWCVKAGIRSIEKAAKLTCKRK